MDIRTKLKEAKQEWENANQEKLKNTKIARFLGVKPEAVSQWFSGVKGVSVENRIKLAEFFGKNAEHFLDSSTKKPLMLITQEPKDDTIYVPFYKNGIVLAGVGGENDDFGEPDVLPFKPSDLRLMFNVSPNTKIGIVPCFGNSMEPTIKESDLVVFSYDNTQIEGAIYIFKYENEIFVKRLKKRPHLALISDNPAYEPINIQDEKEAYIIGRVIGSYSINSKRF